MDSVARIFIELSIKEKHENHNKSINKSHFANEWKKETNNEKKKKTREKKASQENVQ